MTALEAMKKHYQYRDLAAREWKKAGGKVVGYFCNSVPDELISAAGFFPVRISGDPRGSTELARKYFLPRQKIREDFVHSMLNRLITGEYDYLDYLIVPHARESIRRLYLVLLDIKKSDPSIKLPELFFLDVLHTPFFSSSVYNRIQMLDLKKALEEWSGIEIKNEALVTQITVSNESKALLKQVAALRAADRPRISGTEALQIIGSSMFMSKEEHNKLLKQYLLEAAGRTGYHGTRIFLGGSPLDNLQLYEILESSGVTVTGEDSCWGNRWSDVPIDTSFDPLEAIIDRYHNKSPCSRMYPMSSRVNYIVKNAAAAQAQAVFIYTYRYDGAEQLEIPAKKKAFNAISIPFFYLKNQPYLIEDAEPVKNSIAEFISNNHI